jgi:hypothetical protein
MPVIDEFTKACKDLIVALPKLNAKQRKEIRNAVLQVSDELERSLDLAVSYLQGTKNCNDPVELTKYLRNAKAKLSETYKEFKVCARLYDLGDRFKQLFSSIKLSIAIGSIRAVQNLVADLTKGERSVLDDLNSLTNQMADYADELDKAKKKTKEETKRLVTNINLFVFAQIEFLKLMRDDLKRTSRIVVDRM